MPNPRRLVTTLLLLMLCATASAQDTYKEALIDVQDRLRLLQADIEAVLTDTPPPDTTDGEYNVRPGESLQALVNAGVDTINMAPGIYRQDLALHGVTGLVINGNGSTLTGADVITDWSEDGGIYSTLWHSWFADECLPMTNGGRNFRCDPYGFLSEIGVKRELVSIDGKLLRQVLSMDEMEPGTYYVSADRLHVFPEGGMTEASVAVRHQGVSIEKSKEVEINNLTIREFATKPDRQTAALWVTKSSNVILNGIKLIDNNWSGFSLDQSENVFTSNMESVGNGFEGLVGHWSWDVQFKGCNVSGNNWRAYRGGMNNWAVGQKFLKNHRLVFDNCVFSHNYTKGLWIDFANEDVTITGSVIANNVGIGLALEANGKRVTVSDNEITGNGHWGIEVRASYDVEITDNLIADNGAGFLSRKPEAGGRHVREYDEVTRETTLEYRIYKSQNWTVTGNTFRNNGGTATNNRSQTLWFVDQEDLTLFETSEWDYNTYQHSEDRIFGYPGQFWVTLDRWKETGVDQNSTYEVVE